MQPVHVIARHTCLVRLPLEYRQRILHRLTLVVPAGHPRLGPDDKILADKLLSVWSWYLWHCTLYRDLGRIAEDERTEFLRNAYENYGNPTEGYYALPRVMGDGGVDPNMFTGHDQAAIDNARRKFMATHAWARKKKHAADVDVAVKYLLDKGHKFYT